MKNLKDIVQKSINNIRTSIMGTITSVLQNTVFIQSSGEEAIRDVKIISPYGVFSLPLNGQNGQIIFNNSLKKASLVGVEHNNLPIEINPGEVIIYNNTGTYIYIKDDSVYIKGNLKVDGNITYSGTNTQGAIQ